MRNKMLTGSKSGIAVGILIGVLVGIGVTLVGVSILAWLIATEKISENAIGYGTMVILFISALLGAGTAAANIKRLRVQVCLITGGIYYLLLLATTALFFGGQYQGMGITAILVLLGSGLVSLLGIRENKSRKNKFKKHAFC